MHAVDDYLAIRPADARAQWRSILARSPVTSGRQVPFTPVETLGCLAASLLVNHRRYGGSTAHRAAEPVPTLARLFSRPNSSVLAKMANLDGSRRNGARHELEVSAELLGTPGRLAIVYRILLLAARDVGLGPDALPDFLDLGSEDAELLLMGQDELATVDIENAVRSSSRDWLDTRLDLDDRITERLLMAAARVGQHRFANEVLRAHGHRCVFCGLAVSTAGGRAKRMLIASHIKPWRVSTNAERLDPRNGLTACPTHDAAFDSGLITVNGGLHVHVKRSLQAAAETDPATRAVFGRPPLANCLLLLPTAAPPRERYLTWHHQNIYREALAKPSS
ncbi:HNH endonuclease [Micromonospora wenchangensis]